MLYFISEVSAESGDSPLPPPASCPLPLLRLGAGADKHLLFTATFTEICGAHASPNRPPTLRYAPNINTVPSEAPGESADSGGHRFARALLDDALDRRDEQRSVSPLGLDRHEARRVREHLVRVRVR